MNWIKTEDGSWINLNLVHRVYVECSNDEGWVWADVRDDCYPVSSHTTEVEAGKAMNEMMNRIAAK